MKTYKTYLLEILIVFCLINLSLIPPQKINSQTINNKPINKEKVIDNKLSSQDLINTLSLIFLALSTLLILFQIKTNQEFNRRQSTQVIIHEHSLGELGQVRERLRLDFQVNIHDGNNSQNEENFQPNQDYEKIRSNLKDDQKKSNELDNLITRIFNYYEQIALGIANKIYDEQMLYESIGPIFVRFEKWGQTYIQNLQNKEHQSIWINYQIKAKEWRKKMADDANEQRLALRSHGKRRL